MAVGWLPYALLAAALGLYMAFYDGGRHTFPGVMVLLICAGFSIFPLYRLSTPGKPKLILSPEGLQLHVGGRDVLIPWREIQSIDTTDLKVRNWGRGSILFPYITFRDCTMVKVSRPFYEEAIHVPSVFMQGPGWQGVFHAEGNSDADRPASRSVLQSSPQDVRAAHRSPLARLSQSLAPSLPRRGRRCLHTVASRATTDAASTSDNARPDTRRTASTATSALGEPIRFGSAVLLSTPWDMIKLAVALTAMLVVGSNALGIWETAAQEDRRLERQAEAEERRKEQAERDRQKKKWDDFWKDFNRTMDRPFQK